MEFVEQLRLWGPEADYLPVATAEARRFCAELATGHYENFNVVSWMLPRELHQDFYNVYAYCRWADDLGDEVGDPEESLRLLDWWEAEVRRCYAGEVRHPILMALRETIEKYDIPPAPFLNLLVAFRQDQRVVRYDTFEQLLGYCENSANPVGRLVLYLCRAANERNFAWSDLVCTGLQLANFWQDVARDLDIGRVYLPREDCERFGYGEEQLQGRVTTPEFLELMRFETQRARDMLKAGFPLVGELPGRLQIDIELFIRGGLKILERIEAIGYRVWEIRPRVTKMDGLKLLLRATLNYCGRKFRPSSHPTHRKTRHVRD